MPLMAARFYIPPTNWLNDLLPEEEAKHALRVLRIKEGETIELFDGKGRVAEAVVKTCTNKSLQYAIIDEQSVAPITPSIHLYQSIPKGKNMDLIIQKAVELGVAEITPLITQNTVAVSGSPAKKVEKWQRVALEACKQCKQPWLPQVNLPASIDSVTADESDLKLVASLRPNAVRMRQVVSDHPEATSIALVVGPEGDFTSSEVDSAEASGFIPISLGELILRVETATLYGISALRYAY